MERVLDSAARQQELVALGRQQLQQFSWERCALETLDIYRSLL
jgi:glycosyltransferase involved in cell wall biosynthesis